MNELYLAIFRALGKSAGASDDEIAGAEREYASEADTVDKQQMTAAIDNIVSAVWHQVARLPVVAGGCISIGDIQKLFHREKGVTENLEI